MTSGAETTRGETTSLGAKRLGEEMVLILILMKYVAGPFSVDATGRELGRKVSPNDGQPS